MQNEPKQIHSHNDSLFNLSTKTNEKYQSYCFKHSNRYSKQMVFMQAFNFWLLEVPLVP